MWCPRRGWSITNPTTGWRHDRERRLSSTGASARFARIGTTPERIRSLPLSGLSGFDGTSELRCEDPSKNFSKSGSRRRPRRHDLRVNIESRRLRVQSGNERKYGYVASLSQSHISSRSPSHRGDLVTRRAVSTNYITGSEREFSRQSLHLSATSPLCRERR